VALITGLPAHIQECPEGPRSPTDETRESRRAAWKLWARGVREYRARRRQEILADVGQIPVEMEKCRRDNAYWLTVWGTIFEPRNRSEGSGFIPFIPFEKQIQLFRELDWVRGQEDEKADVVISKARAWGGSWILCAYCLGEWLFEPSAFTALLASRKFELVDSKAQKSLFSKIDNMKNVLPAWMMPAGFDPREHDNVGILINPANGNQIVGEGTNENLGRGDRATIAIIDEAQAFPNGELQMAFDTLGGTTDHRILIGTESAEHSGDTFAALQQGDEFGTGPHTVALEWWENPLLDDVWYVREKARYANNPGFFEREYERNRRAGNTTYVYPGAEIIQPDPTVTPQPMWQAFRTWDPGWVDPTWVILTQLRPDGGIDVLDAYSNNKIGADFFGMVVSGDYDRTKPYTFRDGEVDFTRINQQFPHVTDVGDNYGHNTDGSTGDSFYSRLVPFGIYVHRDRRDPKDTTERMKADRTFKGRREALMAYLQTVRFADTPGAKVVLSALKEHKFADTSRTRMSEPKKHLHDWTSHPVSALEFLAVYLQTRSGVQARRLGKPRTASLAPRRAKAPLRAKEGVRVATLT